jgi:8-oxo-dGTP pyrophosphatase MutT (NUDIX family)
MNPQETLTYDGRAISQEWHEADVVPSGIAVSQVTGYCFDRDGRILIVKGKRGWGFPGGHPEAGEIPPETLAREVLEEAGVTIGPGTLIGYMEVHDPENASVEGKHYLQLRYLAQIDAVGEFMREFETSDRMFVPIEDVHLYVPWVISSPTGRGQIETLDRRLKGTTEARV